MISYDEYAEIRALKGMKDSDVAKKADIPQSTFSDWKKGKSRPKADKMLKIADALQMDYREFIGPVGKFSSYNPQNVVKEESKADREFIELYKNADPDVQKAVLTLLKSAKQEP
jgi:transcriptional regulator with XRE-family HTH domain